MEESIRKGGGEVLEGVRAQRTGWARVGVSHGDDAGPGPPDIQAPPSPARANGAEETPRLSKRGNIK